MIDMINHPLKDSGKEALGLNSIIVSTNCCQSYSSLANFVPFYRFIRQLTTAWPMVIEPFNKDCGVRTGL